jgi:plastocyanin
VSGKATFRGKPPPRTLIKTAADPGCLAHKPPRTEEVVVAKDGSLMNVVIYVKAGLPEGKTFEPPKEPVVIDQLGCRYAPHVTTVMLGQALTVTNSDDTLHNVHGLPFNNPGFNVVQTKKGASNTFTFKSAEAPGFLLKCDVHPWMKAYVWVFSHPFAAVTREDGTFSLPPLPPGRYTLGAWHERCPEQEREVVVEAGKPLDVTFTFELEKPTGK